MLRSGRNEWSMKKWAEKSRGSREYPAFGIPLVRVYSVPFFWKIKYHTIEPIMGITPSTSTPVCHGHLSDYELRQVHAIAAWKGEAPGVMSSVINRVAASVGKLADGVWPNAPIQQALAIINKAAAQIAQDDSVLKDKTLQARGITCIEAIAAQPLEFVDPLADRCIAEAGQIAAGVGAATGAGGPLSVAVGIPALLFGALRVIHRVSHCYGYSFTPAQELGVMMGVLSLSTATTPEQRAHAMEEYRRRIETSFIHAALEESANKALQRAVLGRELGAMIPGFNIALNAYLNRQFIIRAGTSAKRVFQEQWLRDRAKVIWIAPST